MLNRTFLFFFFIILLSQSCSQESNKANIEVINGITYIHNTGTPSNINKTVFFKEELLITGEDKNGDIVLYQPGRFVVDLKGNIYISDRSDQSIIIFTKDGKYKLKIGSKGNGPGEFQHINDMCILPDGKLLVADQRSRRSTIFDTNFEFIKSFQWRKNHFLIYYASDSTYITTENNFDKKPQVFIKSYDFSANELVTFFEMTMPESWAFTTDESTFYIYLPFSPESILVGDKQQQWLYHCVNNKYVIDVYGKDGNLFRQIDRPYDPVPFTKKDEQNYRSSHSSDENDPMDKIYNQIPLPKTKTITNRMLVDDLGNLWIETFEEREKDTKIFTAYDIFDKEGYYDARVWCDIKPELFFDGKMYLIFTDEATGRRALKRYEVIWQES